MNLSKKMQYIINKKKEKKNTEKPPLPLLHT